MAAVMTVEFGTIDHYSSLAENSEDIFVQFSGRIQTFSEKNVICDILVLNNHVLKSNMNTN